MCSSRVLTCTPRKSSPLQASDGSCHPGMARAVLQLQWASVQALWSAGGSGSLCGKVSVVCRVAWGPPCGRVSVVCRVAQCPPQDGVSVVCRVARGPPVAKSLWCAGWLGAPSWWSICCHSACACLLLLLRVTSTVWQPLHSLLVFMGFCTLAGSLAHSFLDLHSAPFCLLRLVPRPSQWCLHICCPLVLH